MFISNQYLVLLMSRSLESNIWKYYIIGFISSFLLIAPILIPFFVDLGLSATDVFVLEAAFALAVLISEIPSGYFADVFGRKYSMLVSVLLALVGTVIFAVSSTFEAFLIAELIWGIGAGFRSGADSALLYDTLIQLKQKTKYKFHEGKAAFYMRVATGISAILGGFIFAMSFRLPFYLNIATFLLLIPLTLLLIEPKRKTLIVKKGHLDEILKVAKFCLSNKKLRLLMLFSALLLSSMITGVWAYYLYYTELGIDVAYFGILFAGFSLFCALGSKYADKLEKIFGMRNSLLIIALVPGISLFLLGSFNHILLVLLIFLNGFVWNLGGIIFMDYINKLTKSAIRATVLSVQSLFGRLFFVVLGPLFGWLVDFDSLGFAFNLLGVSLVIVSLSVFYFFYKT